jgi:heterodisulfide reductase subunit B
MKERVTVMDQVMEEVMMAMQGVKENFCVGVIIVKSLENIITKKMIAVRNLLKLQLSQRS